MPDGGPKTYCRSRHLITTVDSENYSLLQLVDFIGSEIVWGSKQYISLWYAVEDGEIEIKSDDKLKEFFASNYTLGVVHMEAQIDNFSGPLQCSPKKEGSILMSETLFSKKVIAFLLYHCILLLMEHNPQKK